LRYHSLRLLDLGAFLLRCRRLLLLLVLLCLLDEGRILLLEDIMQIHVLRRLLSTERTVASGQLH
jgi:hypothetical protein